MKIGIEGTPLFSFSGNLNGIGQYAKRLLEATQRSDKNIHFEIVKQWLFFKKFTPPIKPGGHLSYRVVKWLPPILYYQFYKRAGWAPPFDLVALRKYDAFVYFNYVALPLTKKTPYALFVYDLSYIHYPQYTSPKNRQNLNKFLPGSVRRATHIVTISEYSKREIINHFKLPEDKISIVSPAVDQKVFYPRKSAEIAKVKKNYGVKKPYILSLCTLEPRKNLVGVLDAYEKLPEKIKQSYILVLAGGKGWLDDELEKKVGELSAKYEVIKTGYVPDEDLPALYSGASVFVFPSFYEGFGIPPLEAMACGTPVITSDNTSLPEVVGSAGIMIKAEDTAAITKAMERVLSDKKLAEGLRQKGLVQAAKFSWDKSAEDLMTVFSKLVPQKNT